MSQYLESDSVQSASSSHPSRSLQQGVARQLLVRARKTLAVAWVRSPSATHGSSHVVKSKLNGATLLPSDWLSCTSDPRIWFVVAKQWGPSRVKTRQHGPTKLTPRFHPPPILSPTFLPLPHPYCSAAGWVLPTYQNSHWPNKFTPPNSNIQSQ